MKKRNVIYLLFGLLSLSLSSCDEYLDELPDDRASIDTEDKITSFITSAYGTRNPAFICEYSSDNYTFNGASYTAQVNQEALWKFEEVPTQNNDDPRSQWNNYYSSIGAANAALEAIADLGNPESLKGQRAEALLCRAWGMFRLANIFCMAYNPEKEEEYLGLPYPKVAGQSVDERGTMKELYENLNADIEEALPLIDALFSEVNPIPVKKALNFMGLEVGGLRPPLSEMSDAKAQVLKKAMADYGIALVQ